MPITAISYQPTADSLNVAYRPIVFRCQAKIPDATVFNYAPPVVFCDIYLDGIYYKSLSKTQFITNNGIDPEYEFDAQDALQEVMSYNLPALNGSTVLELSNSVKKVYVKFRNAYLDVNGFMVSEQTAPVQGTSLTDSIDGLGTQSNEIYVYNATIQHEDNQEFNQFLESWKTGDWNSESFPLTKRPKRVLICKNDSSYFPIITSSVIQCFELNYKLKGQPAFQTAQYCYPVVIPNELLISNVVNTVGSNFDIFFASNFVVTDLFSEVSLDGVNWSIPFHLSGIASPQNRVVSLGGSFYVRLSDVNGAVTTYSNVYNWIAPIVCIAPTLISATKNVGNNGVVYVWTTNGFDYLTEVAQLQASIDGGVTWVPINIALANSGTGVAMINGIALGTPIKYRIVCQGNGCSGMTSNVIDTVFDDAPAPLPLVDFYYESLWNNDDTIHNPGINSWVDYLDEFGVQYRYMLGGNENGCQSVLASSIVATNGATVCSSSVYEGGITANSSPNPGTMCASSTTVLVHFATLEVVNGSRVFLLPNLTHPFIGDGNYYHMLTGDGLHIRGQVDMDGVITNIGNC